MNLVLATIAILRVTFELNERTNARRDVRSTKERFTFGIQFVSFRL